jgi:hypothetical protein
MTEEVSNHKEKQAALAAEKGDQFYNKAVTLLPLEIFRHYNKLGEKAPEMNIIIERNGELSKHKLVYLDYGSGQVGYETTPGSSVVFDFNQRLGFKYFFTKELQRFFEDWKNPQNQPSPDWEVAKSISDIQKAARRQQREQTQNKPPAYTPETGYTELNDVLRYLKLIFRDISPQTKVLEWNEDKGSFALFQGNSRAGNCLREFFRKMGIRKDRYDEMVVRNKGGLAESLIKEIAKAMGHGVEPAIESFLSKYKGGDIKLGLSDSGQLYTPNGENFDTAIIYCKKNIAKRLPLP